MLISFVGISPIKTFSQLTMCPLCLRSTLVILSAWLYYDSYGSYAKCLIEGWSYPVSSVPSSQISRLHRALGPSLRRYQNSQYSSPLCKIGICLGQIRMPLYILSHLMLPKTVENLCK